MPRRASAIKAYIEAGARRVFAGAIEWPGWCRIGSDEEAALEALVAYGPRYAAVARKADRTFRAPPGASELRVVERLEGNATTDFGAPAMAPAADGRRIDAPELARLRKVLEACWTSFDEAATEAARVELRKGPRGGGRGVDAIVEHVQQAEESYVRKLAARAPKAGSDVRSAVLETRSVVLDALSRAVTDGLPEKGPRGGALWAPRYFVRRTAWHALDHAWEIEDRSAPEA
jgi:hypothetical protein